ncbi:FixH family protein [Reinekea thalattae]|uniref:FixH family protein n=1 Tax=Reinekea thalattae TaxID=2593301 RepID=A0A5C8ZAI1_9GAMM|nr:FixH family protein [Reinekea thalattae]TXR54191.1 FixH family protein [Reinekea thalattae]
MKLSILSATFLMTAFATGHALACDFSQYNLASPSGTNKLTLGYQVSESALAVDQHFSLQVLICENDTPVSDATLRVDATMPAHRHGMNYRPAVTSLGQGEYQVDGLLFHMAGHWQMVFDVFIEQRKEQFLADQQL